MKKFLAITLTLCMIFSVIMVAPVSAAPIEKQITPVAAGFLSSSITNEANDASNIIDGNEDTMAIIAGSGSTAAMYIDLGAQYTITKIEVVIPSADAITKFLKDIEAETYDVSNVNKQATVNLSTTPTRGGTRINANKTLTTYTYQYKYNASTYKEDTSTGLKDLGEFGYINFAVGAQANPIAISEIRVYGMVDEAPEVSITSEKIQYGVEAGKNIAADASVTLYAESNKTFSPKAAYAGVKMLDNDENTFAHIQKQYGSTPGKPNWAVIDLGEAKNIGGIEISVPTEEQISGAITYSNTTTYPPSNVNLAVSVALTNEIPVKTDYTEGNGAATINSQKGYQINDGGSIKDGVNWTNTTGNTLKYRYIAIYAASSWGAAVSELKVYDDTPQEEKLRFIFSVEHNLDKVDSFGAYIIPFDLLDEGKDAKESSLKATVENTENAALLTSGSMYAVDLKGVTEEYYDTKILALPFVLGGGGYSFGDTVETTVDAVLAAQAQ